MYRNTNTKPNITIKGRIVHSTLQENTNNSSTSVKSSTCFQGQHQTEKTIRTLSVVLRKVIGATHSFVSIIHQFNTWGNNILFSHTSEIIPFLSISKMTVVCLKADLYCAWTFLMKTSHGHINIQFFSDFCGKTSVQAHVHMQTAPTCLSLPEPHWLISKLVQQWLLALH